MPIRVLNAKETKAALSMREAIDAMRLAFAALAAGKVVMPLRSGMKIQEENALLLTMPAYVMGQDLGIKMISLFPNNATLNLPTITGMVIVLNAKTGVPEALLDGGAITAIRTGAVSGLATDLLAAPNASVLAVIGTGAQAYTQLEAVCSVRPIQEIWVYSRSKEKAEKFAQAVRREGVAIHATDRIQTATQSADVICTATSATSPLVDIKDVKPGVHINAVGSHTAQMTELSAPLLGKSLVVVDQKEAALAEAGEVIGAIKQGTLTEQQLVELGMLVHDGKLGRKSQDQVTIFKSVGLAVQDIAAASHALKIAKEKNIGTVVEF